MGFIKKSLFVVVSVLLFLSFLVGNIFWTISSSLDYKHISPELVNTLNKLVDKELNLDNEINKNLALIEISCLNNSEYVFKYSQYTFEIPCEIVYQGSESIVNYSLNSLAEDFYYKDYECGFWDCFEKTDMPFFLVSKKAQDYWSSKFYLMLAVSAILIAIMLLLIEKKSNLLFVIGSLLIISALPLIKIEGLLIILLKPILSSLEIVKNISSEFIINTISIFFIQSHSVFLKMSILGIILIIIGFILMLFKVGFKLSEFFDRISKKNKSPKKEESSRTKKEISEKKQNK